MSQHDKQEEKKGGQGCTNENDTNGVDSRYKEITAGGDVIIYDSENHPSWIQSDYSISLSNKQ